MLFQEGCAHFFTMLVHIKVLELTFVLFAEDAQPVLPSNPEKPNPHPKGLLDHHGNPIPKHKLRPLVPNIAEQPWEIAFFLQPEGNLRIKIELMIAKTGNIDAQLIECRDHLLAFVDVSQDRRRKTIPGKQDEVLWVFGLFLTQVGLEIYYAEFIFLIRLDIVAVVEV